jgi:hypothetical protein
VKTSIFSKYKRAEACIRSSEFYDGNKKRQFIPLGIKINNNMHTFLLVPLRRRYFVTGGIGTFPSPNWTELNSQVVGAPRTSLKRVFFSS